MTGIGTSIELYDRLSAPINSMIGAINNMIGAYQSLDSAMDDGFDPSRINEARGMLASATSQIDQMSDYIRQSEESQESFNNSIKGGQSAADGLAGKLMGMVGAYASFQGVQKLANLSDEYVQTSARLSMINDGLQTQEQLQDKIFASAQRSRASYTATADTVAKLSLQASGAFGSNDETIQFAENLNKLFVVAGTEAQSISSATTQLTQALASGVLRGEEFNAVFEAAPNIMQTVADYMGVPIGQLRQMAADGQITADVVKNALLSATNNINSQFESMPMTWSQVWTGVTNKLYMASQPILELISWMAENWSVLEPIVIGLATAIGIYTAALLIHNAIEGAAALSKAVHGAALAMETGATFAATAAQYGFNAALLACPLTWILLIIIAVIAAIFAVIAVINKVTGQSLSAIGVIAGALMVAVAFIYNLFLSLLDLVLAVVNHMVNRWVAFVNFFANLFNDPVGAVVNLFADLVDSILGLLESLAKAIDKIFGSKLANSVKGWRNGLDDMVKDLTGDSYEKVVDEINLSSESLGLERMAYGDAFDTGYTWGEGVEDSMSDMFGGGMGDMFGGGYDESQIPSYVADTAENTGNVADSMDITSEDLKYLKDIAETEAVNRFTTAEIKIDMTNNNNINNDMDLDGVVDHLTNSVNEAMEKAAEGVHV